MKERMRFWGKIYFHPINYTARCPINWTSGKIEWKYFQTCFLPQENDSGFASSKCKDVSTPKRTKITKPLPQRPFTWWGETWGSQGECSQGTACSLQQTPIYPPLHDLPHFLRTHPHSGHRNTPKYFTKAGSEEQRKGLILALLKILKLIF